MPVVPETTRARARFDLWPLLTAASATLILLVACDARKRISSPGPHTSFQIVLVDDTYDPFVAKNTAPPPQGVAILEEPSIARWPDVGKHHYARLVLQASETLLQAKSRVEPWVRSLTLPRGEHLVWQPIERLKDGKLAVEAYRTYLVSGIAIVGTGDLESATPIETEDRRPAVGVKLSKAAAEHLRQVTHDHVGERLAIIVGDVAQSAPRIESEIRNGMLEITLGGSNYDRAHAEAKALARALMGR